MAPVQAESGEKEAQNLTSSNETPSASINPMKQETAINKEQEREAILKMIAEGRISPEEGELLLEALDS